MTAVWSFGTMPKLRNFFLAITESSPNVCRPKTKLAETTQIVVFGPETEFWSVFRLHYGSGGTVDTHSVAQQRLVHATAYQGAASGRPCRHLVTMMSYQKSDFCKILYLRWNVGESKLQRLKAEGCLTWSWFHCTSWSVIAVNQLTKLHNFSKINQLKMAVCRLYFYH